MARYRSSRYSSLSGRIARRELYNFTPFANLRLPRSPARYSLLMNDFRTFHPERTFRPVLRTSGRSVSMYRPIVRPSRRRRFTAPLSHQLYF